jgi:hypothetical protein
MNLEQSSTSRQPEKSNLASVGQDWNNRATRRGFLKRTGGATLGATFIGWHLSQATAGAYGTGGGSGLCSKTGCGGYTPSDPTVYINNPPGPGVTLV